MKATKIWSDKKVAMLTELCRTAVRNGRLTIAVDPAELEMALVELASLRAWEASVTRGMPASARHFDGDQPRS